MCVAVVECAHCPCVEALGRARIRKHGPWRRVGAITGRYSHCHIRVLTGCSQGTHRSQRRSRYISRRGQAYGSGVGRAWVERRSSESSRAAGAGLGSRRGYARSARRKCSMAAQHTQAACASDGLARARGAGGRRVVGVRSAPSRHAAQRRLLAFHVRDHAAQRDQEAEHDARAEQQAHEIVEPACTGRGGGRCA